MSSASRQQITASEVAKWTTLDAVVESLKHRGFSEVAMDGSLSSNLPGLDDTALEQARLLEFENGNYIAVLDIGDRDPTTYQRLTGPQVPLLVTIEQFETFTFYARRRSFSQDGRIQYKQFRFRRQDVLQGKHQHTILQRLNLLTAESPESVQELYRSEDIINKFRSEFEQLRTELVKDVVGYYTPAGEATSTLRPVEAKERYVQLLLERFIFLHFLQSQGLFENNPSYLRDKHEEAKAREGRTYELLWEQLFFSVLAQTEPDRQVLNNELVDLAELPSLGLELFDQQPVEREFNDIALGHGSREEENLDKILNFLSKWKWTVGESEQVVAPGTLTPSILGYVFEESVNQAGIGAYHTPEELTRHIVVETIEPALCDQMADAVNSQYNSISAILNDEDNVVQFYREILCEFTVVDPAVGTGGFLIAALQTLLDIHSRTIHAIEQADEVGDDGLGQPDLLVTALGKHGQERERYLRREIIQRNLYGVDIDAQALRTCKLRLWLSMLPDTTDREQTVAPLPSLDLSIRRGDSLVGQLPPPQRGANTDYERDQRHLFTCQISDQLEELRTLRRTAATQDSPAALIREMERIHTDISQILDEQIFSEFPDTDDSLHPDHPQLSPFHWPLEFPEVYERGGFDVLIGNPPWERLTASKEAFYGDFIEGFDSMMSSEREEAISQWDDQRPGEDSLEGQFEEYKEGIRKLKQYLKTQYTLQESVIAGRTRTMNDDLSGLFLERAFELGGPQSYVGLLLPDRLLTDLAGKSLREQLLGAKRLDSIITFENNGIFPSIHDQFGFAAVAFKNSGETSTVQALFNQSNLKVLRKLGHGEDSPLVSIPRSVLANYAVESGAFPRITSPQEVAILETYIEHPPASESEGTAWYANPYSELHRTRDRNRFLDTKPENGYPVLGGRNIYQFAYDSRPFPDISSPEFWSLDDGSQKDAKARIRNKQLFELKSELYDFIQSSDWARSHVTNTNQSQRAVVDEFLVETRGRGLTSEDVKLDASEYRIVFRDIARSTDERTLIAAIIPPGPVCHNKLHTLRPQVIDPRPTDFEQDVDDPAENIQAVYKPLFEPEELLAAVGLFNSLPFDYLIRTKIDTTVTAYKFRETQVPHLTAGDEYFETIWRQAAKLNCYGDAFEEFRETLEPPITPIPPDAPLERRQEAQARLDAAAFHAYGFDREATEYILDDFGRVRNPRIVTDLYLDIVQEEFSEVSRQ